MMLDLVPLWAAILAFGVIMYVLLDGFDLGIGILFPFAPDAPSRDLMMNSVAPIWDFNETWLVLGGVGLLAAFPLAFANIIPAVYFPILVMLIGLIFRGVAFEFRHLSSRRHYWDRSFFAGSFLATFAQGIVLGTFVQGIPVAGRAYAGGSLDWVTPFALLTGAGLVVGYALLGACWLVLKSEGELQAWAKRKARHLAFGVAAACHRSNW
jgi:cytochrome d ubiquinol oxidase subunit II